MAWLQPIVFQIMLLLLWPSNELVSEAASIAKPGCPTRCGRVEIPYPFGIGRGCYLDVMTGFNVTSGFEIRCTNHSGNPTIYLDGQWIKVYSISVEERTIEVSFPVISENCGRERGNNVIITLEGSPFTVSPAENIFIAEGCGNLALIFQNGSTVGGCMSICDKANKDRNTLNGTCSGIGCCQTTIPSLKVFNATLKAIDDGKGEKDCRYAYLVDKRFFNPWDYSIARALGYVHVVLEWDLDDQMFKSLVNQATNHSTSSVDLDSYTCDASSRRTAGEAGTAGRCSCHEGFTGNPYLLAGCEDIDECQDSDNYCRRANLYCFNSHGSYGCFSISDEKNRAQMVGLGVGVGVGGLFLFISALWLNKVLKKRKEQKLKEKFFKQNGGLLLQEQLSSGEVSIEKIKTFSSKELEKATDHYNVNRMLGQGGQGTVYKGMLADGRIVAVKKSKILGEGKLPDQGRVRQFINEVVILSQINHRNVVKVLGCCLETEVPLLVYEFIPNGTLFQFLHEQNEEFPLTWDMRIRIASEVAGALAYLHSAASLPIYHRDIKSTNILLDEKYRAKVADFGTSRSVTVDQTHVTTVVQGTFGYLDPEYFRSNQFTDKSDVYSFGVVLVELLTGQKPISSTRSEESRGLVAHFIISMEDNRLFDILDSRVVMEAKKEDIMVVANLAKKCLNLNGKERPTMKEVSMKLEGIQRSQKASTVPPSYAENEYDRKEIVKTWDVFSISMESGLDNGNSSSVDIKPLLSNSR